LLKKAILAFFNSEIEKRGFRFPLVSEQFETARKRQSIPGSPSRLFFNNLLCANAALKYSSARTKRLVNTKIGGWMSAVGLGHGF
jgi:hypothetical protein